MKSSCLITSPALLLLLLHTAQAFLAPIFNPSTSSVHSLSSSCSLSLRTACLPLRSTAVATGGGGGGGGDEEDAEDEVREWPAKSSRPQDYELQPGEIAVRFINSPGRSPSDGSNDVVAAAKPGDVLMAVGDSVGVAIPRGCSTGLCGVCTSDLEDPAFPDARSQLRACVAKVFLPEGEEEMVIDVYRMLNAKGGAKKDPMARFNSLDDPNTGFKARWNLPEAGSDAKNDCSMCGAKGVNAQGMMPEDCTLEPGCPFSKY